jgi:hypothetical protein
VAGAVVQQGPAGTAPVADAQPPRYNLDAWDQMMVERDRRLTGSWRGQSVSGAWASSAVRFFVCGRAGGTCISCGNGGMATLSGCIRAASSQGGRSAGAEGVVAAAPVSTRWVHLLTRQTNPAAPEGFATNSVWETERIR